jgi:hypothetical protein
MEFVLALTALASIVALVVTAPLGRAASARSLRARGAIAEDRRAELEAAKEAKYREIRDARLDFSLGKVSAADHQATEGELRAQALAIVRELETLA